MTAWPLFGVSFGVVGPAFAVVAAAWLLTRWLGLPARWLGWLQQLTFDLLIPLMLFGIAARVALPAAPPWALMAAYYLPTLALFGITAGVLRALLARPAPAAPTRLPAPLTALLAGFAVTYSNVVLLGIPITLAAFGEAGALPLFIIVSLNAPVLFTLLALGAWGTGREDGHPLRVLARRTFGNPILLALLAGTAVNLSGATLWLPVTVLLDGVRAVTPTVALAAMGAGLAAHSLRGATHAASLITLAKLLLHPALVWVSATVLGIHGVERAVLTLLAGMPVGINVYLMALRYETLVAASALAVLQSTLAALLTLTVTVTLLQMGL